MIKPKPPVEQITLPPPIAPARPSRHPFEVWVIACLFFVSISQLFTGAPPGSLNSQLDNDVAYLLSAVMAFSTGITLVGIIQKDPLRSRWIEIAGLSGLVGVLACFFVVGLMSIQTPTSTQGVMLAGGLMLACLHRMYHAARWLKSIYKRSV